MIIGIAGAQHSGKSTAAKAFQQLGFHRMSLASPVYAGAAKLAGVPVPLTDEEKTAFKEAVLHVPVLGAVLQTTGRELLRFVGTDVARACSEAVWIANLDYALRGVTEAMPGTVVNYVLDDVRFKNEAEWIHANGGVVIRLHREGCGVCGHESERQVFDPAFPTTYELANNGTIEDLEFMLTGIAEVHLEEVQ